MELSVDPYRFPLEQPVVAPPGDVWNYNSGGTEVRYANGNVIAGGALRLRPRDLGKIGRLVLQRGNWRGVIPASWVAQVSKRHTHANLPRRTHAREQMPPGPLFRSGYARAGPGLPCQAGRGGRKGRSQNPFGEGCPKRALFA